MPNAIPRRTAGQAAYEKWKSTIRIAIVGNSEDFRAAGYVMDALSNAWEGLTEPTRVAWEEIAKAAIDQHTDNLDTLMGPNG